MARNLMARHDSLRGHPGQDPDMKHQALTYLLLLATAVNVVGCGEQATDTQALQGENSEQAVESDNGILWYAGTVDEAFAAAKAEQKPVYLYWSAAWCPPCHAISATVFKSKSFIDRSRSFIAFYLDGDTQDARQSRCSSPDCTGPFSSASLVRSMISATSLALISNMGVKRNDRSPP